MIERRRLRDQKLVVVHTTRIPTLAQVSNSFLEFPNRSLTEQKVVPVQIEGQEIREGQDIHGGDFINLRQT